jgi:DNA-binding SARP family transcriptional activator/predicted negative regulator of RcsB-dependent stress response
VTRPAAAWRAELLGGARLLGPGGAGGPLERRRAALLAYLALEGPTSRQRLAGLLWPDGGEGQARANLRQVLKRLRDTAGTDLVSGDAVLSLAPGLEVDAARLVELAFAGDAGVLELTGELLAGLAFDDAPELEEWLLGAREGLDSRRRDAAASESERLEAAGEFGPALAYARRRLALEPLAEEAHRRVMRLHYLSGDRGAALAAYERLRATLREELGAEPLPETARLAREIERGAGVRPAAVSKPSLPLAALRPPVLAGREAQWAALEEAWAERRFIFISGAPGAGKSRLALDFAATKGHVTDFSARPGDAAVPYAASARTVRRVLTQRPGLELELPAWVGRELARLLPELGEAPPPLEGAAGRLRLYEAFAEFMRLAHPGGGCYVCDDFQFADPAAVELGAYALPRAFEQGVGTIVVFRAGELSPAPAAIVRTLVAAGALHLQLEPLGEAEVGEVLSSLGVPGLEGLAPQLARHTGGNPQFVLETVRHLIETGQLERGLPARLPPSGRVKELTGRRLERLSAGARDLARVAAVLGAELSAERAARVLGLPALALAEPWAELEAAQLLEGDRFSHDLVFEATLASIPGAVRRPLHRAAAEALEATGATPVRAADQWLAAGLPARAAPRLLEAAASASDLGRHAEAVGLLQRALEAAGPGPLGLEARARLAYPLVALGRLAEAEGLARTVLAQAEDPSARIRALDALQTVAVLHGRHGEAMAEVAEGLELAERAGEERLGRRMRFWQGYILFRLGRFEEAAALLEPLAVRARAEGPSFENMHLLTTLGLVYDALGRPEEARPLHHRAVEGARELGGPTMQIIAVNNLLASHNNDRTPELVLEVAQAALSLGHTAVTELLRSNLAYAHLILGRLEEAAGELESLVEEAEDPNLACLAWARLGVVRFRLGREAAPAFERALELSSQVEVPSVRFRVLAGALQYGTPEQVARAARELAAVEPGRLPAYLRVEFERLVSERPPDA